MHVRVNCQKKMGEIWIYKLFFFIISTAYLTIYFKSIRKPLLIETSQPLLSSESSQPHSFSQLKQCVSPELKEQQEATTEHVSECRNHITKAGIVGEPAKRARHSQVCSIENHDTHVYIQCHSMYVTFALDLYCGCLKPLITHKEGGA